MDNDINKHEQFVMNEIDRLRESSSIKDIISLSEYNDMMVRNFQHERLIHLLVTLFFAILMLASWILLVIMYQYNEIFGASVFPMAFVTLILTILEGFYIRYYYRLENRTQKLYALTERLYKLIVQLA